MHLSPVLCRSHYSEVGMMRAFRGLLTLAILLVGAACGGAASSAGIEAGAAGRPRSQSGPITLDEMQKVGQYSNLYDLVQNLRSRWVRSQGPDTFGGQQGQVQVRMDGNRLGGVDVLRRLSPSGVTSIDWVTPIDAAARFGLDHSHGAIVISTRPVH